MPPYFSGLVRPSRPSSPRRLKTWCAGNASAASHSLTWGLISSSMKRLSVRWISSCSCVYCISSPRGGARRSGPGDAELHRMKGAPRRLVADGQRQGDHAARVARVDDAVVEQQSRRVEGVGLALESGDDLVLERCEFRFVDSLALSRRAIAHDDLHRAGGLLSAHHRGLRGRPGEDEARPEAAPAHAVVAGAERSAALDRDL